MYTPTSVHKNNHSNIYTILEKRSSKVKKEKEKKKAKIKTVDNHK